MTRPLIGVVALAVFLACPAYAQEVTEVVYQQAWRSAPSDDQAPYVFGTPRPYRTDNSGRIYVLDTQLQELHRFGRDGDYQGLIIAAGQGPGELSRCSDFALWPGDRLAVPRPGGAVTVFDLDGRYVESIVFGADSPGTIGWMAAARAAGDAVVIRGERFDPEARREVMVLGIHSIDGSLRHELHTKARVPRNFDRPSLTIREVDTFFPGSRYVLGGDGLVYVAPEREAFVVVVHDLRGAVVRRIDVDWPTRRRSPEEIEATRKQYVIAAEPGVKIPDVTYEIEDTAPAIRRLLWVDGALWVEVDTDTEDEEILGRFVVIDRDGQISDVRDIMIPGLTSGDHAQILRDGRVVVAENYRSALRARYAGANMRVGGERPGEDEDAGGEEGVHLTVHEPIE